jgi:hypothetical protein
MVENTDLKSLLKAVEFCTDEVLLDKAVQLKGTDGEGWAIGDLLERLVAIRRDLRGLGR